MGVHGGDRRSPSLATLVNRWLLPSVVGWTMGRAVAGIRVTTPTGAAGGQRPPVARDLAHLLDTAALFVGWLWPLWDKRHRTFADLLLRTEVRVVDDRRAPGRDVRRIAGCVLLAAAVLCAAGGGLGYLQVYRQDRALEQARTEIAEQGPRIVEQLLSYGTKTVDDDFAQRAGAGHRRVPAAARRAAAGRPEGGRHRQRVLGGEQRGAVGDAGPGGDAAGLAGATRIAIRTTSSSSPRPCGRTSRSRTTGGRSPPHRAEEADDGPERRTATATTAARRSRPRRRGRPMSPRRKVDEQRPRLLLGWRGHRRRRCGGAFR